MFAQRFLGIKKAQENARKPRKSGSLEKYFWIAEGVKRGGIPVEDVILDCLEGRVVRK